MDSGLRAGPRVLGATCPTKAQPVAAVCGTGPLMTVIRRNENIFLSRGSVRRLPGNAWPSWGPLSLVCRLSQAEWRLGRCLPCGGRDRSPL